MYKLRLIAALAGLLLLPAAQAYPLDPYFESVGDSDSLPDNNVSALAQDASGFIWVGTPDGLLRFDGYRFRPYENILHDSESLGGDFVRALLSTRGGQLWVGSNADGAALLDPQSGGLTRYAESSPEGQTLSHNTVRALIEDGRGRVWIGTRNGLNEWDPQTQKIRIHRQRLGADSSANDEHIMALLADTRGNLWVGSWGGLSVRRVGDSRFQRVEAVSPSGASLQGELVQSLIELEDGRVLAGSARAGAFAIAADGQSLTPVPAEVDSSQSRKPAVVNMLQPTADTLWIAVLGGIEVIDVSDWALLETIRPDPALRSSLAHDQIRALMRDQAGQIWVGGYGGGLQRHDPTNEAIRVLRHSPSRPNSLSLPSISSVMEIDPQRLWIGTRGNGIDKWDRDAGLVGGYRPRRDGANGLRNGIVSAMTTSNEGVRWVGTQDGLYRYQPETDDFQLFDVVHGLPNTYIRRLLSDSSGLWIGTDGGLAKLPLGEDRIVQIVEVGGAPSRDDINALVRAEDGRLWVGSSAGLYTIDPGASELTPVATTSTTADAELSVLGLLIDRQGTLWVDSPTGLFRANNSATAVTLEPISARHGFSGQPFGANLLEDDGGRIWSQRFVYDPSVDSLYELSRADGADLGTAWFRAYTKTSRGELLFGGSKGLLLIDPNRFARWSQIPPLVITDVNVDGQSARVPVAGAKLVIGSEQRGFSVEYSALDFTAPLRNRYAHRLDGFDRDWVYSDATRRVASYTRLSPGEYQLRIRGGGRTGTLPGSELVLPIVVQAAWWQNGWFRLLAVVLTGLMIYLAVRLQNLRIRRRSEQLQSMVAARTAELSAAKEAAEKALSQLSGAQRELVSREKLASLGQLVAGVAHEINTPVGVALTASSFLGERCEALSESLQSGKLQRRDLDDFVVQTREAARMIDDNLGRASDLVRNFKQVSVDRSSDDRRRFDLSGCLKAVVSSLELTWKRRPVELELSLEAEVEMDSYPGALGQVVSNLIQNALTHAYATGASGTMRLSTRLLDAETVRIQFSDDGRGISEAALERIFEPFYTTRRSQGGSGLGLHIVFNLVHSQLGGRIRAEGNPEQGMSFDLDLPLAGPSD